MLYEKLEKYIADSEYIKAIEQQDLEKETGALFYGLNHSDKAVVLSHIFRKTGKNIFFVSADDKIAEDYLDDFELLVGSKNCKFLPDYEVLPYEERSPHYVIRAQRIETMTAPVSGQPAIYNLSLRSFLRKMVPRDVFAQNLINLQVGKEYDFARLLSDLVSMGYENQYQVSKVGDIAHRGG